LSLFIMPIAIAGLKFLPPGSNPDLFVLTLPLSEQRPELALLAFLNGFSSATSMMIVAAIAVSTMVSNHIVMPIALFFLSVGRQVSGDVRSLLLITRRISIAAILGLGFLYFRLSGGSDALAAIGLIAFAGVAQFMPSLIGGIFWRGATRAGALSGLMAGFVLWAYTLFLPSFGGHFLLSEAVLIDGLWGVEALRPRALLGLQGLDPLIHSLVWSIGANTLLFLIVSGLTDKRPLERLQGALFVDVFHSAAGETPRFVEDSATSEDLFVLAQRILGTDPAREMFDEMARRQGLTTGLPNPTDAVIAWLEYPYWSSGSRCPFPAVSDEGVCEDDELSHDCGDGDFRRFPGFSEGAVFFLEVGVEARGDECGHIDRFTQICAPTADEGLPVPLA
jgi:hypothetical protein